jgi:hypothetical protein
VGWLTTFRILFILYCVEAGVFLLLSPWSPRWDESVVRLSVSHLSFFLLHPIVRGAISGFGLVHLIWGAHDLDLWLTERKRFSETGLAEPGTEP